MFYIISLVHTNKSDKYLTLWRANNAGYCYSKESAGVYETPKKDYHDSYRAMPIPVEQANKLFLALPYDRGGELLNMIPNCQAVWDLLEVKMTKFGLKRIKEAK